MTVSYSSGVWEVQDQGASRLDVWWRAHFLKDSCLFHMVKETRSSVDFFFIRVLIPSYSWGLYLHALSTSQRSYVLTPLHWASMYEFEGDTHIQSVAPMKRPCSKQLGQYSRLLRLSLKCSRYLGWFFSRSFRFDRKGISVGVKTGPQAMLHQVSNQHSLVEI